MEQQPHMRQPPHASAIAHFNERIKNLIGFHSDSNSRGEEFLAEGFSADGRAQVHLNGLLQPKYYDTRLPRFSQARFLQIKLTMRQR
jgi:hypothetical protein